MSNQKYRVPKDVWTAKKPTYYKVNKHQDLLDLFKNGLLTHEGCAGFLLGNMYKYSFRYNNKGQKESDLNKMTYYANQLKNFELNKEDSNGDNIK